MEESVMCTSDGNTSRPNFTKVARPSSVDMNTSPYKASEGLKEINSLRPPKTSLLAPSLGKGGENQVLPFQPEVDTCAYKLFGNTAQVVTANSARVAAENPASPRQ